jgi:hypothetical protein
MTINKIAKILCGNCIKYSKPLHLSNVPDPVGGFLSGWVHKLNKFDKRKINSQVRGSIYVDCKAANIWNIKL